jgi:hypothetical protein
MKKFLFSRSIPFRITLLVILLAVVIPVVYYITGGIGEAGAASGAQAADSLSAGPIDRVVENVAFGVGEKLTFDINYGFINAGTASIEVGKLIEYNKRPCYQIVSRAESNSFFSTFYRVDDRIESIFDATGLFSWRFGKHLKEGSYQAERTYAFDQEKHLVYDDKDTIEVKPYVQDALSVMYLVRTLPLEIGKSTYVDNYVDGKNYALEVRVLRKETVNVKAGAFDCLVVEPLTSSVGVFKNEGRLTVWLTDDRVRMPVLMKSKILVGSVSAELTDFKLGEIREF